MGNQLDFDFSKKRKAPPPKKAPEPRRRADVWENYDGPMPRPKDEWGATVEDLKAKLVQTLNETIRRVEGETFPGDIRTKTWPYTKAGADLLDAIRIVDDIWEIIHGRQNSGTDGFGTEGNR